MLPYRKILLLFIGAACCLISIAQAEKKPLIIDLSYHLKNNQVPFLTVLTKTKEQRIFPPVKNMEVSVYINEPSGPTLLQKVKTDENGRAIITIDPLFKPLWDSAFKFTFFASAPGDKNYDNATSEINITKARISIDTVKAVDVRTITVNVTEQKNNLNLPAKDVELKIIVARMAGNLSVGDAETYTTDSLGNAVVEFKKDNIPGDKEGYITIIGKVEDNDTYGNMSIEKKVKWGTPLVVENSFNKRTLFATRDKSPLWLLGLAYSIAFGVWATIIYLLTRINKMRKLGITQGAS
jgi:hypothetical protein